LHTAWNGKSFENIYWIAGGVPKSGGIASLEPFFPRIKKAYLIGEAADLFAETLKGKLPYTKSGAMHSALEQAYLDAVEVGERAVVLLSPACASFDQYANFEQRGDHFKQLVKGML
jgi:UDP-N-acetylmuramoylalanine--D-glutamate ligase